MAVSFEDIRSEKSICNQHKVDGSKQKLTGELEQAVAEENNEEDSVVSEFDD